MKDQKLDNRIIFRVTPVIFKWWEAKCEKQGAKKGEAFQKALELAYMKENDPEFSGQDFSLKLENDLADKIYNLAKHKGLDPSDLIKQMIEEKLTEMEKANDPLDVFEKTSRKELRLKPSLMKIINDQALKLGMKPNQYIISVLTAHTTKDEYFFGTEEAHKLGDSNSQLLAIGRNLNQMTKTMNQGIYEAYDREFVGRVHEFIKAHVHQVYKVLVRNKKRWD